MDSIYWIIIVALLLLAAFDLINGVANDAVNFLNSAIGSKAAPVREKDVSHLIQFFIPFSLLNKHNIRTLMVEPAEPLKRLVLNELIMGLVICQRIRTSITKHQWVIQVFPVSIYP